MLGTSYCQISLYYNKSPNDTSSLAATRGQKLQILICSLRQRESCYHLEKNKKVIVE